MSIVFSVLFIFVNFLSSPAGAAAPAGGGFQPDTEQKPASIPVTDRVDTPPGGFVPETSAWTTVKAVFMKIVSVVFMVMFMFGVIVLVLTFRKARKVKVFSLITSPFISIGCVLFYVWILKMRLSLGTFFILMAVGIVVGILWGFSTRIYRDTQNKITSRNSVLYLIGWGAVFTVTQLMVLANSQHTGASLMILALSCGTVFGTSGNILFRYHGLKFQPAVAPVGTAFCKACGANLTTGTKFCARCGAEVKR